MRYIKYTLIVIASAILASCGDPELPYDLDGTLESTGGFVRVISVESAGFDRGNLESAVYSFIAEVGDNQNGDLSESIEFYVRYFPNGVTNPAENTFGEVPLQDATIQVSNLSKNEVSNLPRGLVEINLSQILSVYGSELNAEDIEVGDRFDIRWKLNMKDGSEYTNTDVNASLTGGFYRSPFFARASVAFLVPEDLFVGTYTFEQQNPGVFGWWAFSQVFEADLSVDPNNTLNGRVFTHEPYADDWGGLVPIEIPIELGFSAEFAGSGTGVGVGLGCGGPGLAIGGRTDEANFTDLDRTDDSQFTLVLADNVRGGCGAPPIDIFFEVTKN